MTTQTITTEAAKAPTAHLGFLDGLRALAALFVVFHHAYLHIDNGELGFHGALSALRILFYGHYAVDVFIVLSGFCLMLPIARGDGNLRGGGFEFLRRRAWRILPTYYAALLVSLLLIATVIGQKTGTHWDFSLPVTLDSLLTHLVLLHDAYGEGASINHVMWSIAVEWRIYFLFPILVLLWKKVNPLPTVVMFLAASSMLFQVSSRWLGPSMSWHFLGLFALGCGGCGVAFDPKLSAWQRIPWFWLMLLSAAAVAMATEIPFWHGNFMPDYLVDYLVGGWSMCLLIHLSVMPQSLLNRFCSAKPLAFLGTFAYSIYLVHAPLQQLFWQLILRPLHLSPQATFWSLAAATPLILAGCYGFFLVAERPFLSRKQKQAASEIA